MALLRTKADWSAWIADLGLSIADAEEYGALIAAEAITEEELPHFDHELLKSCSVSKYGHRAKMIRKALGSSKREEASSSQHVGNKEVAIPRPSIHKGVTQLEYDQFLYEWRQFKKHYNFRDSEELETQLIFCCTKEVRAKIREGRDLSSIYNEDELLQVIKDIVLSKVSRMSHIKKFSMIKQEHNESCEDYFSRLQTMATCCEFVCKHCSRSNASERIREKFVLGLSDKHLQTTILRTETHKPDTPLSKLVEEATTLEQSIRDQISLSQQLSEVEINQLSTYEDSEEESFSANSLKFNKFRNHKRKVVSRNSKKEFLLCSRCGTNSHAIFTTSERCAAWGKSCRNCGGLHHFAKMCQKNTSNNSNNKPSKHYAQHIEMSCLSIESSSSPVIAVMAKVLTKSISGRSVEIDTFPDTGANVCLFGPAQRKILKISKFDLSPCSVNVAVAGGSYITATGNCELQFTLGKRHAKSVAYFCERADRLYLKKQSCMDLGIIPSTFPHPPDLPMDKRSVAMVENARVIPTRPPKIPFSPNVVNVPQLKQYLLDSFSSTTFNKTKPFPKLNTPPAHIHLKPDFRIPKPAYWPASVAEHWAEEVHASIEADVAAGILKKVPFNEPTVWCARMVVVKKKDGRPRRTVDFQSLNSQCLREPNHGESPFHTARKVPGGTWKSVFDAVDGYHSVALDEESSKLTTFITPWGRYRYLRFPQGHCSAGDAFNGRMQLILGKIPRMVRIVDDVCVYDASIEESFWHAWDFLMTCANNGIVINREKFQFCSESVDFAGLSITNEGVQPSQKMMSAIESFPPPSDITTARAFFGLVNQVNWAYANSQDMSPFRDLVKPGTPFVWNNTLKQLFESCKVKILQQVKQGVVKYDVKRYTCLQTDFSKEGLGYLLLQKYCSCPLENAPVCCVDGWRLVFAGSRFTKGAEARYAPTEGEALAIAWALNHARVFTLGCPHLLISTDHKPLLGILNSRPLEEIKNPRLIRLKEHTLHYNFTIQYNCGKWHRAPDALSRSPQSQFQLNQLLTALTTGSNEEEFISNGLQCAELAICALSPDLGSLSLDNVRQATLSDSEMKLLVSTIQQGFPATHHLTDPCIRKYYSVRNELWLQDEIVMFKDRIVIPSTLRKQVLDILHSAHQGVEGMRSRATTSIYWPGLNSSIKETRKNCRICEQIAPSQPREPLNLIPHAEYPFQHVCSDAFEMNGQYYLAIVDRYSNWLLIFHFRNPPQAKHIISSLRSTFTTYGAPEKIFTDGGLAFQAKEVDEFFKRWSVTHITSSAMYPQANGRAELAVKTAKRLLRENTAIDGSLNSYAASQALLQYRNTPIQQLGLSPAQILFHRNLKDGLPVDPQRLRPHKKWIDAARTREDAFRNRNSKMIKRYNQGTRSHMPISIGTAVLIQDTKARGKWNRSGTVVDHINRKYFIRMHGSGRIVTRNRRFIKGSTASDDSETFVYEDNINFDDAPNVAIPATSPEPESPELEPESPAATTPQSCRRTPRMMRQLRDFNKRGRKEYQ